MLIKFFETIKKYGMLAGGERVLCALSGGVDSSVLLDLLVKSSEKLGITVCAAHLNHMLRGEDALRDEQFVKDKCREYDIPFICERADIAAIAKKTGESVELCARNVRYDFLRRAKKELNADLIATAHNANDSLETILFNLTRGGGTDAFCGIPPVREDIFRPLIEASREEIESYAGGNNVAFCEDKTNSETVYARNRIRHMVIPEMVKINSAAIKNAVRSAEIVRREADFLKALAADEAEKISTGKGICRRSDLLNVPDAIFARVCERLSSDALGALEYTLECRHISDIKQLCKNGEPSKQIDLPRGLVARCEYEKIVFEKPGLQDLPFEIKLAEGDFTFGEYKISVKKAEKSEKVNNSVNTFYLSYDRIQNGLVIRGRKTGDEIKLPKRPLKTLKKLFIDSRVPKKGRDLIPVVADGERVLAVFGFGQDERYIPTDKDMIIIRIRCGESEK